MRIALAFALLPAACGRFGFSGADAAADVATDVAHDTPVDHVAAPDAFSLPGLVAQWTMDDDPSDGVIDEVVAGHAAHCVAGLTCPTSAAGHRGNALQFDGSTQFVRVTYGPWLATPTAYTYAAWLYIDSQSDQVAFARPYSSGSDDIVDIVAWSTGMGVCMESVGTTGSNESTCGPTLASARWYHVTGRWDGAKKAVFVDGVKVSELPSAVSMMDSSDLLIGSDENTGSAIYFWHGRVDDLEIYDRALTDTEIAELAAQ